MKKIILLLAVFLAFTVLVRNSVAQQSINPPSNMNGFQIDSYPLPNQIDKEEVTPLFLTAPFNQNMDPKILIQSDDFFRNADPKMVWKSDNWNCDPKILIPLVDQNTFRTYDPPTLINPSGADFLFTPRLLPSLIPGPRFDDFNSAKLHIPENGN